MSNIDASQNNKSKRSNRIYSDLDLDFNRNTVTNDIPKVEDINAVKRSVRNLVQTNYYERPFHPELGCGIIELFDEPDSNRLKVKITFNVKNVTDPVVVETFLQRLR